MGNYHFWIVVAMFVIGVILHYPQQLLFTDSPSLFSFLGLTRHAIERIFFLLPVTYAGFFLGIKAGLASLAVALIIMLPRVFLISLYPPDALLETVGIILIGVLVNLGFEGYRREKEHRQQALMRLEAAQKELQSQVQVIRSNEKRLTALNEISAIVSQSLELQNVLNAAADKVREVMDVEVVLVFLLYEDSQELELKTYQGVSEEFAAGLKGLKVGEGFNGQVAQTGEPLLVENASQDLRLTREVVQQERIQATLIVPLKAKDKVVGTLSVATRSSRQFPSEEIELLSHVANYIGVAVDNSRLYQKERLMAEQIARDATMEKQLQENMRFYLHQVTRAQEEERKRIARELHDDASPSLLLLIQGLDTINLSTRPKLSHSLKESLEGLRSQAIEALEALQRCAQDLRPRILDDLGLVAALEWMTEDMIKSQGIDAHAEVTGVERTLPVETQILLFRIAQEALTNIRRHAEASRAVVKLEFGDNSIKMTVSDNGKGFELPQRIGDLASVGKLGLAGMQERARLLGGSLKVESEPRKGTTVAVEAPL